MILSLVWAIIKIGNMAAHRERGVTGVPMAKVEAILEKVKSESALE